VSDDDVRDQIKERLEDADQAAEKRQDEIQQAAEKKIEPHVHEARARLYEASQGTPKHH
jgi:hypothetical protein